MHGPVTAPRRTEERARGSAAAIAAFLCVAALYNFLHEFRLPFTPIIRPGDSLMFLYEAQRMVRGEILYRDFFEFLTPGTFFVYSVLFRAFGDSMRAVNVSVAVLGTVLAALDLYIANKVLRGWAAFAAAFLYLTVVLHHFLSVNHQLFSVLMVTAAIAVLMNGRTSTRLCVAGALCGLATFFTQTRGVFAVAAILVFIAWEFRRDGWAGRQAIKAAAILMASFIGTAAASLSYFVYRAGFWQFVRCTIVFPLRYYSANHDFNNIHSYFSAEAPSIDAWWRTPTAAAYLLVHLLVPAVFVLALYRGWSKREEQSSRIVLLTLVELALCVEIAQSPHWARILAISFGSFILLFWLLQPFTRVKMAAAACLVGLGMVFLVPASWMAQRVPVSILELPIGRVAAYDLDWAEQTQWLAARTHPGDWFFGDPYRFFPLGLRSPAPILYVRGTAYTRPEQANAVLQGLRDRNVCYVSFDFTEDQGTPASGNSIAPIHRYLEQHYFVVRQFSDTENMYRLRDHGC